jgi:hypothetical protein
VADVVRTLPGRPAVGNPSAFTFAFGSCVTMGGPIPTLAIAARSGSLFFAMLGDMGYADVKSDVQNYQTYSRQFRAFLAQSDARQILARMPIMAVQDDHDYGKNDCWADTVVPFAAQAFADSIPGANYPNPTYRRWAVGEVDFFQLDNRRYRDAPQGPFENGRYLSVLRSTQRNWLLAGLRRSGARVKVILSPQSFTLGYSAGERAAILRAIEDSVTGTVVFCTGDRHHQALISHGDRTWELLVSPLQNATKHGVFKAPGILWSDNRFNAVGLVDVDTLSNQRTVTLRVVAESGIELQRHVLPV